MDLKRGSAEVVTLGELKPTEVFEFVETTGREWCGNVGIMSEYKEQWFSISTGKLLSCLVPNAPVRRIRAALYTDAAIEEEVEKRVRERVERISKERDEEVAIVDRVWKALGISHYAQAKGKAIDELVAELKRKAEAATQAPPAGARDGSTTFAPRDDCRPTAAPGESEANVWNVSGGYLRRGSEPMAYFYDADSLNMRVAAWLNAGSPMPPFVGVDAAAD